MRMRLLTGAVAGALLVASPAMAGLKFHASLDNAQAGTTSSATGMATVELSDDQTSLAISATVEGLDFDGNATPGDALDDVTAFHIHKAPAGTPGGVVFGFIGPNSDTNGQYTIDINGLTTTITSNWDGAEGNNTTLADNLDALFNQGLYFNIHTTEFGSGAIRGQIVPEPASLALLGLGGLALLRRRRA